MRSTPAWHSHDFADATSRPDLGAALARELADRVRVGLGVPRQRELRRRRIARPGRKGTTAGAGARRPRRGRRAAGRPARSAPPLARARVDVRERAVRRAEVDADDEPSVPDVSRSPPRPADDQPARPRRPAAAARVGRRASRGGARADGSSPLAARCRRARLVRSTRGARALVVLPCRRSSARWAGGDRSPLAAAVDVARGRADARRSTRRAARAGSRPGGPRAGTGRAIESRGHLDRPLPPPRAGPRSPRPRRAAAPRGAAGATTSTISAGTMPLNSRAKKHLNANATRRPKLIAAMTPRGSAPGNRKPPVRLERTTHVTRACLAGKHPCWSVLAGRRVIIIGLGLVSGSDADRSSTCPPGGILAKDRR